MKGQKGDSGRGGAAVATDPAARVLIARFGALKVRMQRLTREAAKCRRQVETTKDQGTKIRLVAQVRQLQAEHDRLVDEHARLVVLSTELQNR